MPSLVLILVLLAGCQKPNEITNSTDSEVAMESITNSTDSEIVLESITKSTDSEIALESITNSIDSEIVLESITNSIGMKLVLIPAGTFTMGSPVGEVGRISSEMQHEVTLSKSYYLGAFEVTQNEYERVMGNNPANPRERRTLWKWSAGTKRYLFVRSCRRCRWRKLLDGSIDCRQKRNGSTHAVLVAPLHIVLETQRNHLGSMPGFSKMLEKGHIQ